MLAANGGGDHRYETGAIVMRRRSGARYGLPGQEQKSPRSTAE